MNNNIEEDIKILESLEVTSSRQRRSNRKHISRYRNKRS